MFNAVENSGVLVMLLYMEKYDIYALITWTQLYFYEKISCEKKIALDMTIVMHIHIGLMELTWN